MAGRLALELGIDDPEQWLELQPERVIAFWAAFDQRRPIGRQAEHHADIMAMIETLIAAVVNPNLKEHERIKPRQPKDFLPAGLKPKRNRATLKKQLEVLAKVYGGTWRQQ